MSKAELRRHYRALRLSVTPEKRCEWNASLIEHLCRHPLYREADTVLFYYPVKGEPDLLPLAEKAWAEGKRVGFPVSHSEERRLTFHAVSSLDDLRIGTYGIPEPSTEARLLSGTSTTLCLVPGLAFDRFGFRLGYGGGYYDRFLSTFGGSTVAPVYHLLLTDRLPTDEHDLPVAHILTEKGEESLYVRENKD